MAGQRARARQRRRARGVVLRSRRDRGVGLARLHPHGESPASRGPAARVERRHRREPRGAPPATPEELLAAGVTFKDAKERWVATFERDYILQMLRRNNGNISHAARHADIDRKYFRKLMKKYDIDAGADDADEAAE